jgi:hypothetical protein
MKAEPVQAFPARISEISEGPRRARAVTIRGLATVFQGATDPSSAQTGEEFADVLALNLTGGKQLLNTALRMLSAFSAQVDAFPPNLDRFSQRGSGYLTRDQSQAVVNAMRTLLDGGTVDDLSEARRAFLEAGADVTLPRTRFAQGKKLATLFCPNTPAGSMAPEDLTRRSRNQKANFPGMHPSDSEGLKIRT